MSPALVDFREPATPPAPPNPRKGQIPFAPSSLQSDRSSMDRSESSPFGAFASPSPSPLVSASGKPSGLSKPRLVKVRRHPATPRVRQATMSDGEPVPGFNPFRSAPLEHSSINPSKSEAEAKVSENNGNQSGLDSGIFESVKPESASFVFGASSAASSEAKNIGSQNMGAGNLDDDVFVFGSGVEKSSSLDGVLFSKLPDEMRKMKLKDSGREESKQEVESDNVFIFTSGTGAEATAGSSTVNKISSRGSSVSVDESLPSKLPDEMRNLNLKGSGSEESKQEVGEGNVFIFGRGVDAGASVGSSAASKSSGWSSSVAVDQSSFSTLPDEVRKLNSQSGGNEDGLEKAKAADHSSKVNWSNAFIFGNNKNFPGYVGDTTHDSHRDKSSNLRQTSSVDLDEGLATKLPEEMRNLNLQTSGSEDGSNEARKNGHSSKVNRNNICFFGSNNNVSASFGGDDTFNMPEKSSVLSKNSSVGSDEVLYSKLPNEMRKLNLQSSGNEDGFQHTKQDGQSFKVDDSNTFIFGSGKDGPASFGSTTINKLPDEMQKLNIGCAEASRFKKDESMKFATGVFVFGSNSVSSQASTASFSSYDKRTDSACPDGLENLNIKAPASTDKGNKTTENECRYSVDASSGYAFGSSQNTSGSLGGNAASSLPDDITNLHISDKTGNFVGSMDRVFPPSGFAINGASNPLNFTFQAEKPDTNVNVGAVPQSQPHVCSMPTGVTTMSSHPSTPGPNSESIATDFTFTSMHAKSETPYMEFKTPTQDASSSSWFKENLLSGLHQSMEFGTKKGVAKGMRMKKKRGKVRQSAPCQQSFAEQFASRGTGSQENPEPESPGGYSPMDYSPYQETLIAEPCAPEASVTSEESTHLASCSASINVKWEDLVSAPQGLETKEGGRKHEEYEEDGNAHIHRDFTRESSSVDESESLLPKKENVSFKEDTNTAAMETESGLVSSNIDRQDSESGMSFTFQSGLEDIGESSFTFVAPSAHGRSSVTRRHNRRRDRVKASQRLFDSIPDSKIPLASSPFPVASTSARQDPVQGIKDIPFDPPSESVSVTQMKDKTEVRPESISTEAASIAVQETCEKWRLRGNQAYANGLLSKAEECYTRGVNSVSPKETSRSCIQALMLCYSNRAATRMSLGRMREALSDCMMAAAIDPSFLKAKLRAGNCHLALGETLDAIKHFKKCLQSGNGANVDEKISSEASEGLQKAQKVADCMDESAELLQKRTFSDMRKALEIISDALSISPHSESLMEMKAEALLMLRSYEDVIQLCQQTMDLSERNLVVTGFDGQFKDTNSSEGMEVSPGRLWRWRLISKSYFYLGKLEEALDLLQKHEQVQPVMDKYRTMPPVSSVPFSVTVCELLRLKAAGNEAFQAGRHMEAVEHYTAALACNTESRPFAAICFCNRAAAYQALGQITDAIADCSLAIALDGSYPKAISRRATLHEMIRDYGQATNDLHRLISLLEKQSEASNNRSDLKRTCLRLSTMEEEAKKDIPLNMYMILGIEPSSSAADVKKAYRKAALRHHPDKAGQFLVRSENVDDGLWKEIADEAHRDADRLFKMIGEAYTILSDPTKRLQYDAEEEMRTALKKGYGGVGTPRTPKTAADGYNSPHEKSGNRRQWRDGWKSYGSSQQRWSEYSRSNR